MREGGGGGGGKQPRTQQDAGWLPHKAPTQAKRGGGAEPPPRSCWSRKVLAWSLGPILCPATIIRYVGIYSVVGGLNQSDLAWPVASSEAPYLGCGVLPLRFGDGRPPAQAAQERAVEGAGPGGFRCLDALGCYKAALAHATRLFP
jgi:hypothetical protein